MTKVDLSKLINAEPAQVSPQPVHEAIKTPREIEEEQIIAYKERLVKDYREINERRKRSNHKQIEFIKSIDGEKDILDTLLDAVDLIEVITQDTAGATETRRRVKTAYQT